MDGIYIIYVIYIYTPRISDPHACCSFQPSPKDEDLHIECASDDGADHGDADQNPGPEAEVTPTEVET